MSSTRHESDRSVHVVLVIVLLPAQVGYAHCTIGAQGWAGGCRCVAVYAAYGCWILGRVTGTLGPCAGQWRGVSHNHNLLRYAACVKLY